MDLNNAMGRFWGSMTVLLPAVAGFTAGFFGPMVLAPESNQGPLMGIFMTGPGGLLAGAALYWWARWRNWPLVNLALAQLALALALGLGTLIVLFLGS